MDNTYDEALLLAYVEDELSSQQRQRIEQILADDPRLRHLLDEMRKDRQALRSLSQPDSPPWLLDQVNENLERAMLLGEATGEIKAAVHHRKNRLRQLTLIGSLAAMLLIASIIVIRPLLYNDPGDIAFKPINRDTDSLSDHAPASDVLAMGQTATPSDNAERRLSDRRDTKSSIQKGESAQGRLSDTESNAPDTIKDATEETATDTSNHIASGIAADTIATSAVDNQDTTDTTDTLAMFMRLNTTDDSTPKESPDTSQLLATYEGIMFGKTPMRNDTTLIPETPPVNRQQLATKSFRKPDREITLGNRLTAFGIHNEQTTAPTIQKYDTPQNEIVIQTTDFSRSFSQMNTIINRYAQANIRWVCLDLAATTSLSDKKLPNNIVTPLLVQRYELVIPIIRAVEVIDKLRAMDKEICQTVIVRPHIALCHPPIPFDTYYIWPRVVPDYHAIIQPQLPLIENTTPLTSKNELVIPITIELLPATAQPKSPTNTTNTTNQQ